MLALFEMSTLEMWLDIMYNGMDAVGVDRQPKRDHNSAIAVFFVSFVIIGAFFILNLFVSVTIDKVTVTSTSHHRTVAPLPQFHEIKHRQEGRLYLLTKEQEEWVITQRYLWVARPLRHYVPPKDSWRRWIFDGVHSTFFELLIMTVTLLNVAALACTHHDMQPSVQNAIDIANFTCTIFFVAEVAVKLIGLGPRNYCRVHHSCSHCPLSALTRR